MGSSSTGKLGGRSENEGDPLASEKATAGEWFPLVLLPLPERPFCFAWRRGNSSHLCRIDFLSTSSFFSATAGLIGCSVACTFSGCWMRGGFSASGKRRDDAELMLTHSPLAGDAGVASESCG